MKTSTYLLFVICIYSFNNLNAQFTNAPTNLKKQKIHTFDPFHAGEWQYIHDNLEPNKNIIGSPYLFDKFNSKGIVISAENNKRYSILNFNIDLSKEAFVSYVDKSTLFQFVNIDSVYINKNLFVKIQNKIYNQLYKGANLVLYKNLVKTLKPAVINPKNGIISREPEWITKSKYFISINKSDLKEFKPSKKNLFRLFDKSYKMKMNDYIKQQKISFKKEADLRKLILFIDTNF